MRAMSRSRNWPVPLGIAFTSLFQKAFAFKRSLDALISSGVIRKPLNISL